MLALRRGSILAAAVVVAVLVLAGPAYGLSGLIGVKGLLVAAGLCLVPGWLVFAFHSLYGTAAPTASLLGGMAGRMAVVLVGALVAKATWPELDLKSFGLWLGLLYMLTLAVETKLLLTPPVRGTSTKD